MAEILNNVAGISNNTVGFGLSGGGFSGSYHVGVVKALQDRGFLTPYTPLAGVSAGSVIACAVQSGMSTQAIQTMFLQPLEDLRVKGTTGRLEGVLRTALDTHLPHNAHELCSGRLWVGVSTLFPFPRHIQVSSFTSREHLIDTLLASCFVPHYSSAYTFMRRVDGKLAIDGGLTCLVPSLPEPYTTIKVCCLPHSRVDKLPLLNKRKALEGVAIAPDLWNQNEAFEREMVQWINFPGEERVYLRMIDKAYRDTMAWADAMCSQEGGVVGIEGIAGAVEAESEFRRVSLEPVLQHCS